MNDLPDDDENLPTGLIARIVKKFLESNFSIMLILLSFAL